MPEQNKHGGMALDALESDCIPSSAATVILKVISNILNAAACFTRALPRLSHTWANFVHADMPNSDWCHSSELCLHPLFHPATLCKDVNRFQFNLYSAKS